MRVGTRLRARSAATTVATALLVAAAVVGAGWGVQRLFLRAPTRGELLASRVEGVLLRYRYITSIVHVAGDPVRRAECLEGWEPGRNGKPAGRGARVLFSDGERLIQGDRRVVRIGAGANPAHLPPIAQVELAGCSRSMTNHIYGRLVDGNRTHAVPTTFLGKPALRLHVRTERTRFDLFVDPKTLVSAGMRVETAHATAFSRLEPVRLTPALKRSFLERFDG